MSNHHGKKPIKNNNWLSYLQLKNLIEGYYTQVANRIYIPAESTNIPATVYHVVHFKSKSFAWIFIAMKHVDTNRNQNSC